MKRKFFDTHIRHRGGLGLPTSAAPGPNMVTMIEPSFMAPLVAGVGGSTSALAAYLTAPRAVHLSAKIASANEEDAPAKGTNQLIQRVFVFHPPRERKEVDARSSRLYRPCSSAFIRLTEGPGVQPWVLTFFPPLPVYDGPAATANSAASLFAATARRSDLLGSSWPSTYAKTNNKISEQTAKRSILTHHLLPALGAKRLDKITGEDVENLKASLIGRGKTAKRVNNILNVLSKILRYADEIDLIERAPKIKTLKVAPQKFDFFSPEEFERLVASSAQEPDWHAAVLLAGEAGLRMGEILALEWGDIDLKAGTLTVMRNDWRGQIGSPKSGKDREIPLTTRAAAGLKAIRHLKSRLVFCHDDGSRWTLTTMRTGIARQEKRAGLRRTGWHVLRHSFCSHLAGRGVAAVVIKKLAGHSSIAVTNRYMHESEGDLREAISRLGGDRLATTA